MGVLHHAAERAAGVEGLARRHALVEVATPAGNWPAWEFFITPGEAAGTMRVRWEFFITRGTGKKAGAESSSSHDAPPRREPPHALRVLHHAVRFAPLAARSGRPGGWFAGAVHHGSAHRPLRVLHHAMQPVPMTWPPRRWPSGGSSSSPGELLQQLARWTAAARDHRQRSVGVLHHAGGRGAGRGKNGRAIARITHESSLGMGEA